MYSSGAFFNGHAKDIEVDGGSVYGVRIGRELSGSWSFDFSYYYMKNDCNWTTEFEYGSIDGKFTADIESMAFFISTYYTFFKKEWKMLPYFGLSLGISRNEFKSSKESYDGGFNAYAYPSDNTETGFAYRFAIGTNYILTDNLKLNLDLSMMNLNSASSGDYRTFPDGQNETIGKYKFEDLWMGSICIGLKYLF